MKSFKKKDFSSRMRETALKKNLKKRKNQKKRKKKNASSFR